MEAPGTPAMIATKLDEKARLSQDSEPKAEKSSGNAYFVRNCWWLNWTESRLIAGSLQRIFTYAGSFEYTLQGIAFIAAIGSGAGIALQNLIFGDFVTTMTDFANGKATPAHFRSESSRLAYVLYNPHLWPRRLTRSP